MGKMSENYLKILEVGKNVRKFLASRSTKMSENGRRKYKNVRFFGKYQKILLIY